MGLYMDHQCNQQHGHVKRRQYHQCAQYLSSAASMCCGVSTLVYLSSHNQYIYCRWYWKLSFRYSIFWCNGYARAAVWPVHMWVLFFLGDRLVKETWVIFFFPFTFSFRNGRGRQLLSLGAEHSVRVHMKFDHSYIHTCTLEHIGDVWRGLWDAQ
jgi:hypothetical protein